LVVLFGLLVVVLVLEEVVLEETVADEVPPVG
jgi:hypothetical protein